MSGFLSDICKKKRNYVAARRITMPLSVLANYAYATDKPRGFLHALNRAVDINGYGLVAELKKASPSSGLIRSDFNPSSIARGYSTSGAACLSVLTDQPYFQGADLFLMEARTVVDVPILRKDFILDPYQVFEARAIGADAILIILAVVSDSEATKLETIAMDLDLDVLVEIHDEEELKRAMRLQTKLIGINNRNLKTFKIDLMTAEKLSAKLPDGKVLIAESGLHTSIDLIRLIRVGIRRFLIGEALVKKLDITSATRALFREIRA